MVLGDICWRWFIVVGVSGMAKGDCGGSRAFSGETSGDLEVSFWREWMFGGESRRMEGVKMARVWCREILPLLVVVVVRVHGGSVVPTSISYCI